MSTHITMQRLSELGDISRGVTYKSPDDLRSAGAPRSVQLLRATNIQGATIDLADVQVIDANRVHDRQRLATGDIAICIANGSRSLVGKAAIIDIDRPHEYVVGAFCARFRPREGESSDLIGAILETGKYRAWIDRLLGTTTINNLKPSDIADCPVLLPSDQRDRQRLGELLRTSRSLLRSIDALIAAKREQKRGLMQQLLTGKVRFPGFTEPWKTVRLEQVASLRNAKAVAGAALHVRCVELAHIEQGTGEILGWAPAGSTVSLKTAFQPGDVLFGKLRPYLKKFALVDFAGFCSTEIWALVANQGEVTPRYLRLLVESTVIQRAANATSGTKMPRADWDVVAATSVQLPPIIEQNRITSLTWAIETELRLLRMQRVAMSTQRRGLMENLLSGDITIPSSDTSAA